MATLTRDGVTLYYEVHGDGPAILLTHGFSATSQMWQGQIELLSRDHKLIVWDMRGHGRSDYPEDLSAYTDAHTVAHMAAILDAEGVERATIGGLSLGGYMSLAFHDEHPARVSALMIIDSGPGYKSDKGRDAWNANCEATAQDFEAKGLARLADRSAEMSSSMHQSAEGLAKAARGMMAQQDSHVIMSLPNINVPALVLVGADDEAFIAPANYMAGKITNAQKVVIPDAGHASNIDQPEAFNTAVESFLKSLD
ncbi:MAG: alpha/beta fold hydrolase [Candidatus Hydrogenedentota bacterium]